MLITQCDLQAGDRVLIWGAAGGLGVFATQLCAMPAAHAVGVVSSAEKGELVKQLGAVDYIDRNEFAGMMRKGGETPDEEKARFRVSRAFSKRVKEILGDQPDIVFEHVGKATFPTSVFTVKPFGKVVICAGTTGYDLDFDVRYLWMRQKQIIGSHFANAYECNKANELIESAQIRPVLWRTLGFEGVPEAHQLMRENKHLGKIAILVGAEREGEGKTEEGPARSGRRWARDPRAHPLAREPVPGRRVRRGLGSGRRGGARLRRGLVALLPRPSTAGSTSSRTRSSRARPTSSATGTPRRSPRSGSSCRATTTCRCCRVLRDRRRGQRLSLAPEEPA